MLYLVYDFGDRLPGHLRLGAGVHFVGDIMGWPGRLLFMLAGSPMPLFVVTGFLLYLSRRKLRPAKPPALGAGRLVAGE